MPHLSLAIVSSMQLWLSEVERGTPRGYLEKWRIATVCWVHAYPKCRQRTKACRCKEYLIKLTGLQSLSTVSPNTQVNNTI